MSTHNSLARIPRIDVLLDAANGLVARYGRGPTLAALRAATEVARHHLASGGQEVPDIDGLVQAAEAALAARRSDPPQGVLNAAGVVIHTNLGRAPLAEIAVNAIYDVAGYCDLEYNLATGARGSRDARVGPLVADATGAQAGMAVNNAAAALVLVLAALASGREVLVSRGELVEIGGSFRLPEIMAASGARLVEVGTTNRTRASDYREGTDVALLLKVHPSNYRITGFTEAPSVAELAEVARERGVPLVYDVGSGLLADASDPWLAGEPSLRGSLEAGADLVLCSGDKLLGGPQAGLLAGRADLIGACQRHPLARALRLDKLRIAALTATLDVHLRGKQEHLPVWAMLRADPDGLRSRAEELAELVGGVVVDGSTLVGGGSAPSAAVPTPVVRVDCPAPDVLAAALRAGSTPVITRVADGAVWFDLRTVEEEMDDLFTEAVEAVLEDLEGRHLLP
ncbi:MAG: L-seryl-tRNA(Sec) selenium transferase [Egibacteraceae bacterium]